AAVAAATAGLPRPSLAQARGEVIVGTWGGDYGNLLQEHIDRPLAQPAGLTVTQDVASAPPRRTKLLAERQSRRGTMDVAALSDTDMYDIANQNVFDPVSEAQVRRLPMTIPSLRKPYAVPHIYSAKVILYNPNRVNPAPRSYADLWDPRWRGRVGLSDLLYMQYTETAAIVGGGSPSNFEPAWQKLREWRALGVRVYPSNEALAAALQSEEVWLTVMWLARGFMWRQAGIPVRHAVPSEGATSIAFEFAVPRNARNKEAAWRWIDLSLDPRAQVGFARTMGYLPTVTDAQVPADIAQAISLTEQERANLLTPDYAYVAQNHQRVLDFWNRDFKGG
ncbi:MAG TPA: extracellular solute-binding protein, partial [Acetobacteraceae bacterium]|nr:extracellular solute-binding protein [Acetobacteraceae bacterium]